MFLFSSNLKLILSSFEIQKLLGILTKEYKRGCNIFSWYMYDMQMKKKDCIICLFQYWKHNRHMSFIIILQNAAYLCCLAFLFFCEIKYICSVFFFPLEYDPSCKSKVYHQIKWCYGFNPTNNQIFLF